MSDSREIEILEVAENMIRQGGYNSFSFRNIAAAIGIKSSSVHYHFSTKEDLGAAVTRHYTNKFISSLGSPVEIVSLGKNPINLYIEAFRNAFLQEKGMCLCGVLGSETEVLPERVAYETALFFKRNIEWLESAYRSLNYTDNVEHRAIQTVSLLEGAMIIGKATGDITNFDAAVLPLRDLF